jgi:hypothetical protein
VLFLSYVVFFSSNTQSHADGTVKVKDEVKVEFDIALVE